MDITRTFWNASIHLAGVLAATVLLAGCGPGASRSGNAASAANAGEAGTSPASSGNEMQQLDGIPVAEGKLTAEQHATLVAPPATGAAP